MVLYAPLTSGLLLLFLLLLLLSGPPFLGAHLAAREPPSARIEAGVLFLSPSFPLPLSFFLPLSLYIYIFNFQRTERAREGGYTGEARGK